MDPQQKPPCPYCGKENVGLECPEPECRRRLRKQLDEPAESALLLETPLLKRMGLPSRSRNNDPSWDNAIRANEENR